MVGYTYWESVDQESALCEAKLQEQRESDLYVTVKLALVYQHCAPPAALRCITQSDKYRLQQPKARLGGVSTVTSLAVVGIHALAHNHKQHI